LDSPGLPGPVSTPVTGGEEQSEQVVETTQAETVREKGPSTPPATIIPVETIRVFISHGKQRGVTTQIKELLAFGNFEPVISVEREATAIPVPEKVFEDMRSCKAGVINVTSEGNYLDKDGNQHQKINDNVLIEIGAAMALYGKKVVLLVEKGLTLPSNLQGLYRCDYEGERLDYDATMKLLKTFSQFR
jgi:predicted nucleotide-binding protein